MRAYISPILYKQYCKVNWLEDTDDSVRRFLREVGTHSVSFQDVSGVEYRTVPSGTCVRLLPTEKYAVISTRYLNLYSTFFNKQEEVRFAVPAVKSRWSLFPWCG